MQASLEIRWFFDGTPDAEIRAALSSWGSAQHETRRDRYLFVGGDGTGLKLREGRLELKWRLRSRATSIASLAGHVERWHKASMAAEWGLAAAPGPWLEVDKRRWQWRGDAGATELARIAAGERTSWSLAIESFGVGPAQRRWFVRTLARLARSVPAPERFTLERSFGYPRWLGALFA